MKACLRGLALFAVIACQAEPVRTSASGEVWAYGTAQEVAGDSPLNPGNQVANLPGLRWTGDARLNLRLAMDGSELIVRPRLLEQYDRGDLTDNDAYLSQAFARVRLGDALTLTAGRDLLTWGPANFRSPSNPLYFDAGRTDPLREVPGVDLARLTYTQGPLSLMLVRELGSGHPGTDLRPDTTTLAKADLRGEDMLFSAVLANPVWGAPFYGGFAQASLGQAWLVYGEIGSGSRPQALEANPAPSGAPFTVQTPSPRQTTGLLGASYTLLNGQSIALEWLRDGHGFTGQGENQFFARAARIANQYLAAPDGPMAPAQLAGLGQGLSQAPAPLGRDYASLLWQSNPQDTGQYWRLMWTGNLRDHSGQVSGYGEKSLSDRFTAFAVITWNLGGADSEFGDLVGTSLTVGIKCFAF